MNSLLSFSHTINNHSQSLTLLNKHALDINTKLNNIEQKIKDFELIQNKLQNHILSSEGSKSQPQSSSPVSEDRIRIIIKEYVDIALKNILEVKSTPVTQSSYATPVTQSSYATPVTQSSYAPPVSQSSYMNQNGNNLPNFSSTPNFSDDNNVFAQLEQAYNTNITDNTDIIIEEKKVKKPVGRKSTKKL
jgi:hypothetical protein